MMLAKIYCSIIIICFSVVGKAQSIHWTTFENLNDSLRKERKPLMIFIHTDWCKYCKMQDNNTFSNSTIIEVLNKKFYCVRLHAEEKNRITFLNRQYVYKPSGVETGYHQLAEFFALKNGSLTLPTTVFLNDDLQPEKKLYGFYNANQFLQAINWVIER